MRIQIDPNRFIMRITLACLLVLLVVVATVSAETIHVKVNWFSKHKEADFEIDTNDKVSSLKQKIQAKFGVEVADQWLFSLQGILQDDDTLAKYHLKDNDEVGLLVLNKGANRVPFAA